MTKIFKRAFVFLFLMLSIFYISCGTNRKIDDFTPYTDKAADYANLRIYQVMVSSFQDGDSSIGFTSAYGPQSALKGGDIQGIINAVPYIKNLGCNAIWMTPVFDSSSAQNISGSHQSKALDSTGYYAYDFFNIDSKFGTNEKFAELVDTCHKNGIYVILDGVFGHWNAVGVKTSPKGNRPSRSHGQYDGCDYPASLEFFKEVATYWIKNYKIDGWRLDQCYQAGASGSGTYTGGHNYWKEIRAAVLEACEENQADETVTEINEVDGKKWGTLGYMVGECWERAAGTIQAEVVEGHGLNSCFDFPSRYLIVDSIAREEWNDLDLVFKDSISSVYDYAELKGYDHSDRYLPNLFVTNHDTVRLGDQINQKYGSSSYYYERNELALSVLAGYTGPITIYYGDEWGAKTGCSIIKDSNTSVGDGAYWDNSSRSTGKISGFSTDEQASIDYVSKLMKIRSEHEALWNGYVSEISTKNINVYACKKYNEEQSDVVYVILNNSDSEYSFKAGFAGYDLIEDCDTAETVSVSAYSAKFIQKR